MKYALNGILIMIKSQHNAWIHALATIIVCVIGFYFVFTKSEWCWIVLAIILVWITETLNTAIEFLADAISPNYHPLIGQAKDVAAGAVLISAIGYISLGMIIIIPNIYK